VLRINIHQLYREKQLLKAPLNITIRKGQCVILSGPNGSGKSSVLRCLAGLKKPSNGTITLDGMDIRDVENPYQKITYLGHQNGLPSDWPVAEIKRHFIPDAALDHPLWPKIDPHMRYKNLSVGQQRRLALANILVEEKSYYLLDEPMASLDQQSVKVLINNILDLNKKGRTTILATHREIPDKLAVNQVIKLHA
jgi:ABC-type transport system involved in cytochrome c biogenesis ATPase subunit